jgi:hypothetical protein
LHTIRAANISRTSLGTPGPPLPGLWQGMQAQVPEREGSALTEGAIADTPNQNFNDQSPQITKHSHGRTARPWMPVLLVIRPTFPEL